MDFSKAKIVGYIGTEPVYEINSALAGSKPGKLPGSVAAPALNPTYEAASHDDTPVGIFKPSQQTGPARVRCQNPDDSFCLTCMANDFIDLIEEGLDPFLDECQDTLKRMPHNEQTEETRKELLKKMAFGSEASIQLKGLVSAAQQIFTPEN
jgi:hypothetical protein